MRKTIPSCGWRIVISPTTDALHNLSTAIIVDQQRLGGNPRSTLGTATDVFTMFRVSLPTL